MLDLTNVRKTFNAKTVQSPKGMLRRMKYTV